MTTFEELWAAEQERQALAPWKARVAAAGFVPVETPWTYVVHPRERGTERSNRR